MSKPKRQFYLNAFLLTIGHHEAAWRHPKTKPEHITDVRYYQRLAIKAEEAKLDSIFLSDRVSTQRSQLKNATLARLDPITLLAALASVTRQVGLIATASTSFNEPLLPGSEIFFTGSY